MITPQEHDAAMGIDADTSPAFEIAGATAHALKADIGTLITIGDVVFRLRKITRRDWVIRPVRRIGNGDGRDGTGT